LSLLYEVFFKPLTVHDISLYPLQALSHTHTHSLDLCEVHNQGNVILAINKQHMVGLLRYELHKVPRLGH